MYRLDPVLGPWSNMTFCLWGRGVEVLVDPFTLSQSHQIRLMSSLFCDVGIRYPGAFAVTGVVTQKDFVSPFNPVC
jgi:hypothetical protein